MKLSLLIVCALLATCSSAMADVFQFLAQDGSYLRYSEVMVHGERAACGSTDAFGKIRIDRPAGARQIWIRFPGEAWRTVAVQFDGQNNTVKVYRVPPP